MQFTFIEIFGLVGGTSGLTAFLQYIITAKIQRKKEQALANQEVARVETEKGNSLKIADEVYALLSERVKDQLEDMHEEINKFKIREKEFKKKIDELTLIVQQFKQQCKNCKIIK